MNNTQSSKQITLGKFVYTITVLHGNHGGWLFVRCDKMTIYEQPGYKDYDKALIDGELIVRADYEEKLNPKPMDPNSPWAIKR